MVASPRSEAPARPRVVIAGLGDTGLLVAVRLGRRFDITGVATKPSLVSGQELGNRLADPETWRQAYWVPLRRFRALDPVTKLHGRLTAVDPAAKTVAVGLADGSASTLPYDVLVIATGVTNGFWRNGRVEDDAAIAATMDTVTDALATAATVAIVGGGATGVSAAINLSRRYPDKAVHLFYSQDLPLPGYHPRTRRRMARDLERSAVVTHPGHRAVVPEGFAADRLTTEPVTWSTGQAPFPADQVLWTVGQITPHSGFLPPDMVDDRGFVRVDEYLRVPGHENIYAVGDIAASDPHRSSARNWGAFLVARNIRAATADSPGKLRRYQAPRYRWGSVVGVQPSGLRVFNPRGISFVVPARIHGPLLMRGFMARVMYRGLRAEPAPTND